MTAIYFAGGEIERLARALIDNGVRRVLFSFYYIVLMNRFNTIERLMDEYPEVQWFLDSGAFTYYAKFERDPDKLMDLSEYKKIYFQYIDSTWRRWERITELDMDNMFEDVTIYTLSDWREEMLELWPDAPIMPVWHECRGLEEWSLYCRDPRIRHLAIGSGKPLIGRHRKMVLEAHQWNKTVHGFGMTNINALKSIPYDTVDSSSWAMGQKYGTLFVFRRNQFKRISAFDAKGKAVRREYKGYFRNIGCDPDLVFADDLAETRKANIIAWRNLSNRFEEMRRRQNRTLIDLDYDAAPVKNENYPVEGAKPREGVVLERAYALLREGAPENMPLERVEALLRPVKEREAEPSGDQETYAKSYPVYDEPIEAAAPAKPRKRLPNEETEFVTDRVSNLDGVEGNKLTWFRREDFLEGTYAKRREDGEDDERSRRPRQRDADPEDPGAARGVPGDPASTPAGPAAAGGRNAGACQDVRDDDAEDG